MAPRMVVSVVVTPQAHAAELLRPLRTAGRTDKEGSEESGGG
eukprot:CAMPEP_0118964178 /NCGR_PEP_ID=MMETSP1173-20130426/1915_1 /TAXON_ID=1034831 /ORGANISM="Rhizochromulina marina cf, Strain CCMP1243" /LENGTH=41 /DNA_ID= /DNA_START= /DNA_END= /DNA_ORIENTATION=